MRGKLGTHGWKEGVTQGCAAVLAVGGTLGLLAACGDGALSDSLGALPPPPSTSHPVTAKFDAGPSSADAALASPAKEAFVALEPLLESTCGGACHASGMGGAPTFLAPPDPYASIKAFSGIVVKDVATSLILNKGPHEGPDLVDPLRTEVQNWLTLEATDLSNATLPQTDDFAVSLTGTNTVDLSKGGVPGVSLTFDAALSGDVLTLTNMTIIAPATTGVHIVFPIFVIDHLNGGSNEDDSFSNTDQTIPAATSATLYPACSF